MSEDRTISSGADRGTMEPIDRQSSSKTKFTFLLLALLIIAPIIYFTLNSNKQSSVKIEDEVTGTIKNPQFHNLDIPPEKISINEPEEPNEPKEETTTAEPEEEITVAEIRAANAPLKPDPILARRMSSGISTININNNTQNQNKQETTNDVVTDEDENIRVTDYDGQGVAKITASKIKNRSLIITQGAKLPCTLETALDSTVPGMTSCIVGLDVYSSDGKVRLIDRGSKLNGRYQGSMTRGQARIAILWERLETPEGVIINLSSPSTDPLGRAGAGGYVDTHFWERFGNAIMLSLVSDAFQYLDDSRSNRENRFQDTEESTQEMAQIALENEINIAPTLYKNQGEEIMVFINKDLSFENVYELGLTNPPTTFEAEFRDNLYK